MATQRVITIPGHPIFVKNTSLGIEIKQDDKTIFLNIVAARKLITILSLSTVDYETEKDNE